MNWSDIPAVWQECFEVAWESFQQGARPIGAVILNESGKTVAKGKSTTFISVSDSVICNNELAHAEVNALLKLDNREHKKVNNYTLYSTLEPCPLCFSAFYMSGIRNLEYAAKDKYGGSTNLKDTTPYLSKKTIQINGPMPHLENLSIVLYIYFDLMINYTKGDPVHDLMESDYPEAVALGRKWASCKKLKDYQELSIEDVYDMVEKDLAIPLTL